MKDNLITRYKKTLYRHLVMDMTNEARENFDELYGQAFEGLDVEPHRRTKNAPRWPNIPIPLRLDLAGRGVEKYIAQELGKPIPTETDVPKVPNTSPSNVKRYRRRIIEKLADDAKRCNPSEAEKTKAAKALLRFWRKLCRKPPIETAEVNPYPDEISESDLREGKGQKVFVNKYERNPKARKRCIDHYGARCCICDFSFRDTYGIDKDFIHVHHVEPVSAKKGTSYKVDPIKHLRPVCPNCHAVIHIRKGAVFTPEEVTASLRRK